MTTSTLRALRGSLLAGLLALGAMAVLAAAGYSPEERKFVDRLPQLIESQCIAGATSSHLADAADSREATQAWLDAMRGPQGACACVSKEIMAHVTPELLHRSDLSAQVKALEVDAGAVCIARMVHTVFPTLCPTMMRKAFGPDAGGGANLDPSAYIPDLCQCILTRMDALTAPELRTYMQSMMAHPPGRDQALGDAAIQALPDGFQRDVRECGYATLNRMMDDRTAGTKAATPDDPAKPQSNAP